MTLSQIRARAREQVADQYNVGYDNDALLDGYINEGYARLAAGRIPGESMLTVTRGRADLSAIERLCAVRALSDEQGREKAFVTRGAYLYTAEDGLYVVSWRGEPEPLTADQAEPALPAVYHGSLADYGSWRLLSNGGAQGQSRAQFFYARFEASRADYLREADERSGETRLRNKYS